MHLWILHKINLMPLLGFSNSTQLIAHMLMEYQSHMEVIPANISGLMLLAVRKIEIYSCPCNNGAGGGSIPAFVGNDYYCESAATTPTQQVLYS